jgi:hypothetical protein
MEATRTHSGNVSDEPGCGGYRIGVSADDDPLRISQYVYFALKSETVSAATITACLGVEPDSVSERGFRRSMPPLPACHRWAIECRQPGLTVDEQAAQVLNRVRPLVEPIRTLTTTGDVSAVLQVVRYFNREEGEPERHAPVVGNGRVLQRLAGQHQLLGWHLAVDDLSFLASIPADLDIDEYG